VTSLKEELLGPRQAAPPPPPVLDVAALSVTFRMRRETVVAVDSVSWRVERGRTLGVVGESGSGKTAAALGVMGLIDPPGEIEADRVGLRGTDLCRLPEKALSRLRGRVMAMVFQEPMTALNPVLTVGDQVAEPLILHQRMGAREAWRCAVDLLHRVGIPLPLRRANDYPHQLSGGMRQRVMIAMALACNPSLLFADEPTTSLDVTVQAQILDLILALQEETGMAIQFISHDLGVISEIADEVAVMYAGRIVEQAPAEALFETPLHPYTHGLLATLPQLGRRVARLPAIPGAVPDLADLPRGCAFRTRCPKAGTLCAEWAPALEEKAPGRRVACHFADAP